MLRFVTVSLAAGLLAGCTGNPLQDARPSIPTCDVNPAPCAFDTSPLRVLPEPVVLPKRPYQFFPTATALRFSDARGQRWVAPERTLTDGASIPRIFVSIVGDPTSPEFISAAALHDAYCGVGNEGGPNFHQAYWEDVHIMFYDGLIEGGTPPLIARVMFAAVWLGGPRWPDPRVGRNSVVSSQGVGLERQIGGRSLRHVPTEVLQAAMRSTRHFIETEEPSFLQTLAYLRRLERSLLTQYPANPPEVEEVEEAEPAIEELVRDGDGTGDDGGDGTGDGTGDGIGIGDSIDVGVGTGDGIDAT